MQIVRTTVFLKDAKRLRLTAQDMTALETELTNNPEAGDKIEGLKGMRKVRFAIPSRNIGKRGGGRAIYLVWERGGVLLLLKAYAKNEQTDLSQAQRRQLLEVLEELSNG